MPCRAAFGDRQGSSPLTLAVLPWHGEVVEKVVGVTGSPALDVVLMLVMAIGWVASIVAFALVGGWADRRLSSTAEQALADLRRYGPHAAGLRLDLLPPDVRTEVLRARREHAREASRHGDQHDVDDAR
jgi:hypothetical protein